MSEVEEEKKSLSPYMKPIEAWALALGTSVGWGSLVVTSNTYLAQAGPLGSMIGLVIGAVIMLVIGKNYHYMINCFPDAGGAYSYAREVFGYDHGFVVSWFLSLTYAAMLWANATSLPLFAKYFIGDMFRFGRMYTLFGYDVYIGEALLSIAAILIIAVLCMKFRRAISVVMTILVFVFSIGILVCFAGAIFGAHEAAFFSPAFIPDKSEMEQIIKIASISPWAFIGFENISHSAEEYSFSRKKVFSIMACAIVAATLLYVFVMILSVSAYPSEYGSWMEYIRDIGNLEGIKGLPAFYAANHYLGGFGVIILVLALFALIVTSLIGNITALGRLMFALAKDNIISQKIAKVRKNHVPQRAVILIALISLVIPFVGRTAIGWIVDVTTIGATLIYGFVSASSYKMARKREDRFEKLTGLLGLLLTIAIGLYLLLPNLFASGSMEKESYILFVIWGVIGFLFFRAILSRDKMKRFGHSIIVWIAMLSLVLFVALIWMNQSMIDSTENAMNSIHQYYNEQETLNELREKDEEFVEEQMEDLERSNSRTMIVVAGLFVFSLIILFTNYTYMNRKAKENEEALDAAHHAANTDPLTGVKSKHAFVKREEEINRNIQSGSASEFAVTVCDVNGLKYINDTYGHKAGDEYILSASRLICGIFQHSPVFRIGGDEFVVLLEGRDYEHRHEIMQTLSNRSKENIAEDKVVVAAGCSDYESGSDKSLHAVFERADNLMYQNKQELKKLGAKSR